MFTKKAGCVLVLVAAGLFSAGCSSRRKTTLGLDMNVYLHPSSSDPADILLQTAITKRLTQNTKTRDSLIHVKVEGREVVLTGAAKPDVSAEAFSLAEATTITLNNEVPIVPIKVTNRIDTK